MYLQDGDGYILIDVPDENFAEAYGVLSSSTGLFPLSKAAPFSAPPQSQCG